MCLFFWTQTHIVLTSDVVDEMTSLGDELKRSMTLSSRYEHLMRVTMFFTMFGSPSFSFASAYVLLYSGFIAWLSLLRGDLSRPQFKETLSQQPMYALACFVLFFILQKRELKRFLEEATQRMKRWRPKEKRRGEG